MGRDPGGENGTYLSPEVKRLMPHHRSMARMFVEGVQPMEIATLTGFTPGHISRILGSPLFQVELNRLEEKRDDIVAEGRQEINDLVTRATEVLSEDLFLPVKDTRERKIRQTAALETLDRAGIRKTGDQVKSIHLHKHETKVAVGEMSTTDLLSDILEMNTFEG